MNQPPRKQAHFISLRWRLLIPLALVLAIATAFGTYIIAASYTRPLAATEEQRLLQAGQGVLERTNGLYITQRTEAQRIAFTEGLLTALQTGDNANLQTTLRTLAQTAQLDSVLIVNMNGIEIMGLLYVEAEDAYGFSTGTNLGTEALVQQLITQGTEASGLVQTTEGVLLYVGVPMVDGNDQIGAVLVGLQLDTVLAQIEGSTIADLILYDGAGLVLQTTLPLSEGGTSAPTHDTINQTLVSSQPLIDLVLVNDTPYRAIYTPFVYGQTALGVSATLLDDSVATVATSGRSILAIFLSILAGSVVMIAVLLINRRIKQLSKIRFAAQAVAQGQLNTRTGFDAVDEVGAVGRAIDDIARASQMREDQFSATLQRERQDRRNLVSVLDTISDGLVLFDSHNQLLFMNQVAREHLRDGDTFTTVEAFLGRMTNQPRGQFIAPDLRLLGEAQPMQINGRNLTLQVAEVMNAQQSTGRAIILQESIKSNTSTAIDTPQVSTDSARELAHHAATLQRLIAHMRELTENANNERQRQTINAETLILAVANDWRQIAKTTDLDVRVVFKIRERFIMGNEQQLRRALGNLVDNAIKYTPRGGAIALEVLEEIQGKLYLRVRDNGVGVAKEDIPHLFEPFYRGTPTTETGELLRVPGLGDGLTQTRRIIRAHGGSMKVKSRLGVGTAVYFSLPITQAQANNTLPTFADDLMEGETVGIPEGQSIEDYWDQFEDM